MTTRNESGVYYLHGAPEPANASAAVAADHIADAREFLRAADTYADHAREEIGLALAALVRAQTVKANGAHSRAAMALRQFDAALTDLRQAQRDLDALTRYDDA